MPTLTVTVEQLRLIEYALDFYSRVGIAQIWVIKDHPTFENVLGDKLRVKKPLEVGDKTERGTVTEIGKGYVKTKGFWSAKEEERTWKDVENIKHSIDYGQFHDIREKADKLFNEGKNLLLQEDMDKNGSYGIHNSNVHESCRTAFDIKQVIRHEFWKRNPDRSEMTVDSHIHFTSTIDSHKIKCNLDENE